MVAVLSRGDHWLMSKGRGAHGEVGQAFVLFAAMTITHIARSFPQFVWVPDHTHARIRPFLLTFHSWPLQALDGRIRINLNAPHRQIVVGRLLVWRTGVGPNQSVAEGGAVPGGVDVRNAYACTIRQWHNLEYVTMYCLHSVWQIVKSFVCEHSIRRHYCPTDPA